MAAKQTQPLKDKHQHRYEAEDHEDEVLKRMKRLSLFETYHLIVEGLLYSSDNSKKDLYRDGDPQVFMQLLAEDDCDLTLLDVALPNQFTTDSLNAEYRSLRPYMINMYRHTIQKTSGYMENCIIHDNTKEEDSSLGTKKNKEIDGDVDSGNSGPTLLIERAESYYKKNRPISSLYSDA